MGNKSNIILLIGGMAMLLPFFGVILIILDLYYKDRYLAEALSAFAVGVFILLILYVIGIRLALYFYLYIVFLLTMVIGANLCLFILFWRVIVPMPFFGIIVTLIVAAIFYQYYYKWKRIDIAKVEKELIRAGVIDDENCVFRKSNLTNAKPINYFGEKAPGKNTRLENILGSIFGYVWPFIIALPFILIKFLDHKIMLLIISLCSSFFFIGFSYLLLPNLALLLIIRKYEQQKHTAFKLK